MSRSHRDSVMGEGVATELAPVSGNVGLSIIAASPLSEIEQPLGRVYAAAAASTSSNDCAPNEYSDDVAAADASDGCADGGGGVAMPVTSGSCDSMTGSDSTPAVWSSAAAGAVEANVSHAAASAATNVVRLAIIHAPGGRTSASRGIRPPLDRSRLPRPPPPPVALELSRGVRACTGRRVRRPGSCRGSPT